VKLYRFTTKVMPNNCMLSDCAKLNEPVDGEILMSRHANQ